MIFLLIEHKRSYGPTGIGTITGLTVDMNSGTANAEMVNSTGDGARRRGHCGSNGKAEDNQSG